MYLDRHYFEFVPWKWWYIEIKTYIVVVSILGKTHVCRLRIYFLLIKTMSSLNVTSQEKTSKRKLTSDRFEFVRNDTVLHTDALYQISDRWPAWFQRKTWHFFYIISDVSKSSSSETVLHDTVLRCPMPTTSCLYEFFL